MPVDIPVSNFVKPGRVIFVAGLAAVIMAFTVFTNWLCFSNCRSIEPLDIVQPEVVDPAPSVAVGAFQLTEATGFGGGISTDGLGGGCVVFRLPTTKKCQVSTDCVLPKRLAQAVMIAANPNASKPNDVFHKPSPFIYCSPAKSCWAKISEGHCWKSGAQKPVAVPLELYKRQETPKIDLYAVRDMLFDGDNGPDRVDARVIACLNGKFKGQSPCSLADLGGSNFIEKFGKIYSVELPHAPPPLCPPPGVRGPAGC